MFLLLACSRRSPSCQSQHRPTRYTPCTSRYASALVHDCRRRGWQPVGSPTVFCGSWLPYSRAFRHLFYDSRSLWGVFLVGSASAPRTEWWGNTKGMPTAFGLWLLQLPNIAWHRASFSFFSSMVHLFGLYRWYTWLMIWNALSCPSHVMMIPLSRHYWILFSRVVLHLMNWNGIHHVPFTHWMTPDAPGASVNYRYRRPWPLPRDEHKHNFAQLLFGTSVVRYA